jgi:hypothetical protein
MSIHAISYTHIEKVHDMDARSESILEVLLVKNIHGLVVVERNPDLYLWVNRNVASGHPIFLLVMIMWFRLLVSKKNTPPAAMARGMTGEDGIICF